MSRQVRSSSAVGCTLLVTLATASLATACGAPQPCPKAEGSFACVEGATLALAPAPGCEFPIESSVGVEAQTAKALQLAARVWGVEPKSVLTGWTISYCRGWFACVNGADASWTYGCARLDEEVIHAAPGPTKCLPGVLVHELGHLVLGGDGAHKDPRFAAASALAAAPCE